MASDDHEERTRSVALPAAVDDWIDEAANRHDVSPEAFCRRILAAAHAVNDSEGDWDSATHPNPGDPLESEAIETLQADLEAQREEFVDHVGDVRERVVQLKAELDASAPADHDHDAHASDEAVVALEERVERLQRDTDALEGEQSADRPLSDVAQRVADASPASGMDSDLEDRFDHEGIEELDSDQLWAELERDPESTDVPTEDDEERAHCTISKHQYCHQCEHFAEPPVVACTNEGTDIVEMPSLEAFRVADCPVVLEDEALERNR